MQKEIPFLRDGMGDNQPLYINDEVARFDAMLATRDSQHSRLTQEKLTKAYVALVAHTWLSKQRRRTVKKLREQVFQLLRELQEQDEKMASQTNVPKLREQVFQLRDQLRDQEQKTTSHGTTVIDLKKRLQKATEEQKTAQEKLSSSEARYQEK